MHAAGREQVVLRPQRGAPPSPGQGAAADLLGRSGLQTSGGCVGSLWVWAVVVRGCNHARDVLAAHLACLRAIGEPQSAPNCKPAGLFSAVWLCVYGAASRPSYAFFPQNMLPRGNTHGQVPPQCRLRMHSLPFCAALCRCSVTAPAAWGFTVARVADS